MMSGRRFAAFLFALSVAITAGYCHAGPRLDDPEEQRSQRLRMVRTQIEARGVSDPAVLHAMRKIKRHLFMPPRYRAYAYADSPQPIGKKQTISQPYIVAAMTEALKLKPNARVLEIGTGSGYQAAVLAEIAKEVYSIEIVPQLAKRAKALLKRLGYKNIFLRTGDGYRGWPKKAPFDAIILTAAPPRIPSPLIKQLAVGGILIAPIGRHYQRLVLLRRNRKGIVQETLLNVRFVPMTGEAQRLPDK
jgi:protein-L-isoaspartate(D-aspartate) O-methyltransferase